MSLKIIHNKQIYIHIKFIGLMLIDIANIIVSLSVCVYVLEKVYFLVPQL